MQAPYSFQEKFKSLVKEDPSMLDWFGKKSIDGMWIVNLKNIEELWISESFWNSVGFKVDLNFKEDENLEGLEHRTEIQKVLQTFVEQWKSGETLVDIVHFFSTKNKQKSFHVVANYSETGFLVIRFFRERTKLKKLQKQNELFKVINQISSIGGWEVDLETNTLEWTHMTKDIHEVPRTFIPDIETAINFYKEGWSRDLIIKLFRKAVEKGENYDVELKINTAKGNEKWVRSIGRPEMKDGKCIRIYGAFQDIDARKKKEVEHQLVKERFEKIFSNTSLGIILLDRGNKLILVNPASVHIFGFDGVPEEEIMELTYQDLIYPDDFELVHQKWGQLISGEIDSYSIECRFYKKSGELIWCRVYNSLASGNELINDFIISQVEDITDEKQLKEQAFRNANLFKGAFEYSPNGMALVSLELKWLMVNNTLAKMVGYTKEEMLQLTIQDLTHPEDRETNEELMQKYFEHKSTAYSVQRRYLHKDGTIVHCLLCVSLLYDSQGNPKYFIAQINDISSRVHSQQELKKSLNELQSLLDATTQVSIIETDLRGNVKKINKGTENLLGYTSEESIGKLNVLELHDPKEVMERSNLLSDLNQENISGFQTLVYQANHGLYDSGEWTFIRKDGSRFSVQLIVTAIRNHDGEITGYLGVGTDISNQKKMEASLVKSKQKAEAANRSKSEFLANMSHEIRTPLNGIIGFTDLLMKTSLTESQEKYMATVYNSANLLLDIINDILDFSKIEAGKLELNIERVNISELLVQTIDIIKHQAHAKGLEVLLDIPSDISPIIYADPVRLQQILTNLLGNAVKFTEKGEIEIKVRSVPVAANKNLRDFHFSIRDTGIGIASHNLSKIFRAFDQEDASTTRKYGGTGLGLTISNKLLELMDSKLQVKSVLHKGSTFSFDISFKIEEVNDSKPNVVYSNVNNVLVVDDNENNRHILIEMLKVNEIKVSTASNGIEGLELLEKNSDFDLMIVDYNMPYLNGVDFVAHVRNDFKIDEKQLPIVLLHSSVEDNKLNKACKELKIRHNITKPVVLNQLMNVIKSIEEPVTIEKEENVIEIPSFDLEKIEKNVLIVEDNPVNKMLAKTLIQKIIPNATILEAEDGLEAIELFLQHQVDIIFMDVQMPRMSGFEATKRIRGLENNGHTPIIALTARTIKGEKEKCLKAGMDDYVTKPVIYETVEKTIVKYLT
ncbi:PAS domain S-box protein [Galbibacter sp. BG1]|uniref:PAS domain-containing hybrid sensor histidine kinase/response regulator n=1 Tax=Galbibacter sp. BG1 TaxID=1170699 RepID=UPI0015BFBD17|nr:PAS domain-containing hybrid sensor histidine kinase/response regulator [Galbibacter sp. BG1]QLE00683.1 PAS domain S-box protein [Galbibacter sp. BG1]